MRLKTIMTIPLAAFDWQEPESIALVIMGVIELITLVFYFRERRSKNYAEEELKLIKRRGDAPYILPSDTVFGQLYHDFGEGEVKIWSAMNGNVLCFSRGEVPNDCPAGTTIVFVVSNIGEPTKSASVKLDGQPILLKREVDFDDAKGLYFLEYPYAPEKHGKDQILTVSFETRSGAQDTHKYITKHGKRHLERIDPPLP